MRFQKIINIILSDRNMLFIGCAPLDNEYKINIFKNALNLMQSDQIYFLGKNINSTHLVQMLRALQGTGVTSISWGCARLGNNTGAELVQIFGALQGTNVTNICLEGSRVGRKSAIELAHMLGALQGTIVTTINLLGNRLGRKSGAELAQILRGLQHTNVDKIYLSNNMLYERTGAELAQMLGALQYTKVTKVHLGNNRLGEKDGAELAQMLGGLQGTNVTTLDLWYSGLGARFVVELRQMLGALRGTKVKKLSLNDNGLGAKTGAELAYMLEALQGTKVISLNLAKNGFGAKTGAELSHILNALQTTEVTTIELSSNGLDERTGVELAEMLGGLHGTKVTTVDLSYNNWGAKTGLELAQMLRGLHGTKVTTVNLGYNKLGEKNAAELAQMLRALQDTNVTTINLAENNFDENQRQELSQILKTIPNIRVLGFDDDYRFVAHNLLVDLKRVMQDGDEKYDQAAVKVPKDFAYDNLHLLTAHLKENYSSLGCFASGLLLSNIITKQQAKQTPTPPEEYKEAIDLLLASTTNPSLLNFVRNNLIELKIRMEKDVSTHPDYVALKQHYTYVENLIDAKLLKFASLIKDIEHTAPRNPGFYFARQGRMDWERQNRSLAIGFLTSYGFEHGNVNANNSAGCNPIMQAIALHDYEMCLRLHYSLDAKLDVVNLDQDTLLHLALKNYQEDNKDSEKIILWLIEMGGDIKAADKDHKTPVDIAKEKDCEHLLSCAFKLSSDEEELDVDTTDAARNKRPRLGM